MIIIFYDDAFGVHKGMENILKEISKYDDGTWKYSKVNIEESGTYLLEGNIVVVEYANDDLYGTDMYEPLPGIGEDTYIIECMGGSGEDEYYVTVQDSPDTYTYGVVRVLNNLEGELERFSTYDRTELRNVR